MIEIWKKVEGYGDMYEVSNLGRVRSFHRSPRAPEIPHVLRPGKTTGGYHFHVMCDGEGFRRNEFVHKMVAEAFIGPRPSDWTVNHKDRDKDNNRVENLEWMTHADNIKHSQGFIRHCKGESKPSAKLTEEKVREIRRRWDAREATCVSLAKEYGVSDVTIWTIVKRKKWKHVQ